MSGIQGASEFNKRDWFAASPPPPSSPIIPSITEPYSYDLEGTTSPEAKRQYDSLMRELKRLMETDPTKLSDDDLEHLSHLCLQLDRLAREGAEGKFLTKSMTDSLTLLFKLFQLKGLEPGISLDRARDIFTDLQKGTAEQFEPIATILKGMIEKAEYADQGIIGMLYKLSEIGQEMEGKFATLTDSLKLMTDIAEALGDLQNFFNSHVGTESTAIDLENPTATKITPKIIKEFSEEDIAKLIETRDRLRAAMKQLKGDAEISTDEKSTNSLYGELDTIVKALDHALTKDFSTLPISLIPDRDLPLPSNDALPSPLPFTPDAFAKFMADELLKDKGVNFQVFFRAYYGGKRKDFEQKFWAEARKEWPECKEDWRWDHGTMKVEEVIYVDKLKNNPEALERVLKKAFSPTELAALSLEFEKDPTTNYQITSEQISTYWQRHPEEWTQKATHYWHTPPEKLRDYWEKKGVDPEWKQEYFSAHLDRISPEQLQQLPYSRERIDAYFLDQEKSSQYAESPNQAAIDRAINGATMINDRVGKKVEIEKSRLETLHKCIGMIMDLFNRAVMGVARQINK